MERVVRHPRRRRSSGGWHSCLRRKRVRQLGYLMHGQWRMGILYCSFCLQLTACNGFDDVADVIVAGVVLVERGDVLRHRLQIRPQLLIGAEVEVVDAAVADANAAEGTTIPSQKDVLDALDQNRRIQDVLCHGIGCAVECCC